MKKYIILLCSAMLIFGATSCVDEGMDFDTNGGKGLSFVHFKGSSQTIAAKAGANTTTIAISSTVKSDQARTYTLIVDPTSTAKEGTHYTLSSKTVTIPAGQFEGSVTLTASLENLTPETLTANFSINSEDAIDYGKAMKVSMYLFFEVTWDWLLGTWIWTDYDGGAYDSESMVEITKIDNSTIGITGIWEGDLTIEATVDFSTARIIIKPSQKYYGPYEEDGDDYGYLYMDACPSDNWRDHSRTDPIIGSCSYLGTISIARWAPMLLDTGYGWGVVLTSKLTRP